MRNVGYNQLAEFGKSRRALNATVSTLVPAQFQGQDRITFLDQNGNPVGRIALEVNDLGAAGSADEIRRTGASFIANQNIPKAGIGAPVAAILMRIGIYARVRPVGHFWERALWI